MATRYYLPGTDGPAPAVSPTLDGIWDQTTNMRRCKMGTSKRSTTYLDLPSAETSTTDLFDVCLGQFISNPIAAQTISGTISYALIVNENNAAANMMTQMIIKVVSNDGTVERGKLYSGNTATAVSGTGTITHEWATSYVSRTLSGLALSSVDAQEGDRLVIEFGYRANNTSATSYTGHVYISDNNVADLSSTFGESYTVGNPWFEFSANIQAAAAATPPKSDWGFSIGPEISFPDWSASLGYGPYGAALNNFVSYTGSNERNYEEIATQISDADITTGTGSNKWVGLVLAPNGMIYGIPRSTTTVLKIDPSTDAVSVFGTVASDAGKWEGGVLAPNGMIYGIPRNSSTILKIDPTTDTATTFGSLSVSSDKWVGGVVGPNGMIYGIPLRATSLLKIDPSTDTATNVGTVSSATGVDKWEGGVLAPNGYIYAAPHDHTAALKFDPTTDTATEIGSFTSDLKKWIGGVLAPNGCIYFIPYNATTILKLDPSTDTFTQFGSLPGSGSWIGGVLAGNGMIYGIPYGSSTALLKIDPTTDTATTVTLYGMGNIQSNGGVLAPNGSIYAAPYNANVLFKWLKFTTALPTDATLSRYTNKF